MTNLQIIQNVVDVLSISLGTGVRYKVVVDDCQNFSAEVWTKRLIQKVQEEYQIENILLQNRHSEYVEARYITIYMMRNKFEMTFNEISKIMKLNHATAIHGCATIRDRIDVYSDFGEKIAAIWSNFLAEMQAEGYDYNKDFKKKQ